MLRIEDVIVQPVQTEKSVSMPGKYTFNVHVEATKPEVKLAIKKFYGKEVEKVNMVNLGEKIRIAGRGRSIKKRSNFRKAIVTLKEGQTLNFNDFK